MNPLAIPPIWEWEMIDWLGALFFFGAALALIMYVIKGASK